MHCKNLLNANNNIINTKPNNYGYRYLCHNKVSAIIAKHGYIIDSDYCYMIAVMEKHVEYRLQKHTTMNIL